MVPKHSLLIESQNQFRGLFRAPGQSRPKFGTLRQRQPGHGDSFDEKGVLLIYDPVMTLVPELYCSDISITTEFYLTVLRMKIKYQRKEESFVYLFGNGIDIMVEQINGNSRKWVTGKLEHPFGRGVNFQWTVNEIDEFYQHILKTAPNSIFLPFETKAYQCGNEVINQRQFIVQDPDGYLFRFCSNE